MPAFMPTMSIPCRVHISYLPTPRPPPPPLSSPSICLHQSSNLYLSLPFPFLLPPNFVLVISPHKSSSTSKPTVCPDIYHPPALYYPSPYSSSTPHTHRYLPPVTILIVIIIITSGSTSPSNHPPFSPRQIYDLLKNQLDLLFSTGAFCCCKLAIVGLLETVVVVLLSPPPRSGLAIRLPMLKPPRPVGEPSPLVLPAFAASSRSLTAASCTSNL